MGKPIIPKKRVLSLRPEQRKTAEVSIHSRDMIDEFVKKTRNPFGEPRVFKSDEVKELETTLRKLEKELLDRERSVQEMEQRLTDKQREIWEAEALLDARQQVYETRRAQLDADLKQLQQEEKSAPPVSPQERVALEALQSQIDEREEALQEARDLMKEREQYIEEAEAKLFEKTMQLQERETELDLQDDELTARRARMEGKSPVDVDDEQGDG
ncbi:MAG: hypothetical protein AAGF10_01005 [Verrucomicrobiota bacterium]